jgi:hypothetical protein
MGAPVPLTDIIVQSVGNTGDQERSLKVPLNVKELLTANVLPAHTVETQSWAARGPIGDSPTAVSDAETLDRLKMTADSANTALT